MTKYLLIVLFTLTTTAMASEYNTKPPRHGDKVPAKPPITNITNIQNVSYVDDNKYDAGIALGYTDHVFDVNYNGLQGSLSGAYFGGEQALSASLAKKLCTTCGRSALGSVSVGYTSDNDYAVQAGMHWKW